MSSHDRPSRDRSLGAARLRGWARACAPSIALAALGVFVAVPAAIALTPAQGTIVAGQHVDVRATTPSTGWLDAGRGPATVRQIGQTVVELSPLQIRGPLRPQLKLGPLVRQQDIGELLDPRHGRAERHHAVHAVTGAFLRWYLAATLMLAFVLLALIAIFSSAWIWVALARASRHEQRPALAAVWYRLARRIRLAASVALAAAAASWLVAGGLAWHDTKAGLASISSPRELVGAAPVRLHPKGAPLTGYTGAVIGDSRAARLGGPLVADPSSDDRSCKRSSDSLAAQLQTLSPGERVANLACSGATIAQGLIGTQHRGQRAIVPQMSRLLTSSGLQFVVVMVGPNDLDWTDFLKYCYAFTRCDDRVSDGQFDYRLAAFDRSYGDLLAALSALPDHPRIVVVGSYDVFGPDADCDDTRGPAAVPGLNPHNLALLADRNAQLNAVLAAGAKAYGNTFVVPYLKTLCEPTDTQVGADLQGLSDAYPFHPTGVGMVRLAAPVFAAINAPPEADAD